MISLERMKEIAELRKTTADDILAIKFNVSEDTIRDYARRWVQHCSDKKLASGGIKILLFDLETDFMVNATWHLYPKYIHIGQIIKDWSLICWSAKWLFEDEIFSGTVTPEESLMRNDRQATIELFKLIDEADVVSAHNLLGFDRKKMNTCFLKHGLGQPSPYQLIDTLKIARSNFAISSNKLDYLAKFFKIPMKHDTGFSLWRECDGVDAILNEEIKSKRNKIVKTTTYNKKIIQKALDYMVEYCKNDVSILENVYLELRAYDKRHPNLALYGDCEERVCSICGSVNLFKMDKKYYTAVSKFDVYKCDDCGAFSRVRFADKRHKKLLRGVAR